MYSLLAKYLVEYIGTFIFLSVILVSGEPFAIGLALTTAIFFGGKVSGGNFNPAVSTMMYLKNKLNMTTYLGYVLFQILGAVSAYLFNEHIVHGK